MCEVEAENAWLKRMMEEQQMIIAVIPARGGSKRLPRKNVKHFAGYPLIAYSILAAKHAQQVNQVIVSSDDHDILEIASQFGAAACQRPAELSTDTSTIGSVLQHVLSSVEQPCEAVVLLQPSNVLRPPGLVNTMINHFLQTSGIDSMITVSANDRKVGSIKGGFFVPEYIPETRSQDLSPSYFENGVVYISSPAIVASGQVFGEKIVPFIIDEIYALGDIDTEDDFRLAECLFHMIPTRFVRF